MDKMEVELMAILGIMVIMVKTGQFLFQRIIIQRFVISSQELYRVINFWIQY